MRWALGAAVLGLHAVVAMAADEGTQVPKEGSSSGSMVGSYTSKVLALGKDRIQVTWEFLGAAVPDDDHALNRNASVRCVGAVLAVQGVYENYMNSCAWTRPDGDQYFTVSKGTGKVGATAAGTFTITGGTGKLAGISGGGEWSQTILRPALEGTGQSVTRAKLTWKLPP